MSLAPAVRTVIVALTALMLLGPALAAGGDPGSGGDASGKRSSPTLLPAWGSFTGTFKDGTDADWYGRFGSPYDAPVCVEAFADAAIDGDLEFSVFDYEDGRVRRASVRGGLEPDAFRAGLAVSDLDFTRFGLRSDGAAGEYAFALEVFDQTSLGPGDAGSGGDAGALIATALSRPCNAGTLGASDSIDLYSFTAPSGSNVTVSSVAPAGAVIRITDATGRLLAETSADGVLDLALPTSGLYYASFSTSAASPTSYLFGLTIWDPGREPCRPACI